MTERIVVRASSLLPDAGKMPALQWGNPLLKHTLTAQFVGAHCERQDHWQYELSTYAFGADSAVAGVLVRS